MRLLIIMLFICGQVMAQKTFVVYNNKEVVDVQMFTITETVDANGKIKYAFSPNLGLPINKVDAGFSIALPDNQFTMLAFFDVKGNIEWAGVETGNTDVRTLTLNLVFGDGYMYVSKYSTKSKIYEHTLYGDLLVYTP
jgi:hypothetical protein